MVSALSDESRARQTAVSGRGPSRFARAAGSPYRLDCAGDQQDIGKRISSAHRYGLTVEA